MRLTEALSPMLNESYIDIQRFGFSAFQEYMSQKNNRMIDDNTASNMLRDYVKRFWQMLDRDMVSGNDANINAWARKIQQDPTRIREWVDLVDRFTT